VTVVVMLGFGMASSIAIQGIEENDAPWAGAFERISAYALMTWFVAVALPLMRRQPRHWQAESGDLISLSGSRRPIRNDRGADGPGSPPGECRGEHHLGARDDRVGRARPASIDEDPGRTRPHEVHVGSGGLLPRARANRPSAIGASDGIAIGPAFPAADGRQEGLAVPALLARRRAPAAQPCATPATGSGPAESRPGTSCGRCSDSWPPSQLATVTGLTVLYVVLPLDGGLNTRALAILAVGLLVFGLLAAWQVCAILRVLAAVEWAAGRPRGRGRCPRSTGSVALPAGCDS
jgi:hypothetical protein